MLTPARPVLVTGRASSREETENVRTSEASERWMDAPHERERAVVALRAGTEGGIPPALLFHLRRLREGADSGELMALLIEAWGPSTGSRAPKGAPPTIDSFDGDNDFLSNFFLSSIRIEGFPYRSVEHAFQAAKTMDEEQRRWVAAAPTCGEAKRRGRRVPLRPNWDADRVGVMRVCLEAKFKHPTLRAKLLATGDAELVEGNTWHDNVWGDCRCGRAACRATGQNLLGNLLMEVRAEARYGYYPARYLGTFSKVSEE